MEDGGWSHDTCLTEKVGYDDILDFVFLSSEPIVLGIDMWWVTNNNIATQCEIYW